MGGLDWFRLLAAFLVVTIHTSPLGGISEWADLTLTRIVGRVAVPFFFMVTGYFVLAGLDAGKIRRQLKKLLFYYLIAIVLYVPVNWYAGRLQGLTAAMVLQELLVQGTFYHLWYLPALMTGLLLSWGLLRFLGNKGALAVSAVLYLLGLLGDSYYGLAAGMGPLKAVYEWLFGLLENTRNGFFLAPLFLIFGALFHDGQKTRDTAALPGPEELKEPVKPGQPKGEHLNRKILRQGICLAVSLAAMTAEGLLVHRAGWPHHDSMYLLLPMVMIFLFDLLLRLPVPGRPVLRQLSLWIYLLHPLVIVVVRAFAKVTETQAILVDNSLIHFLSVAAGTALSAWVLVLLGGTVRKGRQKGRCRQ